MNEKRKLKKIVLRKEEIVNLNDYQMGQARGGTLWKWTGRTSIIFTVVDTIYGHGKEESWWNCDYSKQANCMTDISNKLVNLPDGDRACEIPGIEIDGYLL